jgi:hypothetical protein
MSRTVVRRLLAFVACGGALAAAALTPAPVANAYPSCGLGILSVSTPWGGFCDTPPIDPQGQHFHCQWGAGFELCEYRWADNTAAPFPGQFARIGGVLR